MATNFFADLHVHPSFKNYNRSRFKKDFNTKPFAYTLFTEGTKDDDAPSRGEEKGKRKSTYEQAALIDCFPDRKPGSPVTKLMFIALYPLERGWVIGNAEGGITESDILREKKGQKKNFLKKIGNLFAGGFFDVALDNPSPLRSFLQKGYLGIPYERIRYFQGYKTFDDDSKEFDSHLMPVDGYHYFGDLVDEYEFICRSDNTPYTVDGKIFQYRLLRTQNDLTFIKNNSSVLGLPLTIEGAHVFSIELNASGYMKTPMPEMLRRIDIIKTWKPFFLTLCHHFDNMLCGHAHSMPLNLAQFVDQRKKMNTELTADGVQVIKKLLAVDNALKDIAGEHRILIDVKHMSALARKKFYNDIVKKYSTANPGKTIPVICSHCAYSGTGTLDKQIAVAKTENYVDENQNEIITLDYDAAKTRTAQFYNWNINLCDEDIKVIVESNGLIGLTFDQRVLGHQHDSETNDKNFWMNVWVDHIVWMAKAWMTNCVAADKTKIYDCLCIGSDFDGIIDPMNDFGSIKRFKDFYSTLVSTLKNFPQKIKDELLIDDTNGFTSEEIADKICYNNTLKFLEDNLK